MVSKLVFAVLLGVVCAQAHPNLPPNMASQEQQEKWKTVGLACAKDTGMPMEKAIKLFHEEGTHYTEDPKGCEYAKCLANKTKMLDENNKCNRAELPNWGGEAYVDMMEKCCTVAEEAAKTETCEVIAEISKCCQKEADEKTGPSKGLQ